MAGNLDATWEWLTDNYKAFRKREKRQSHVAKISGYLMSYGDKTGAVGSLEQGGADNQLVLPKSHSFQKAGLDRLQGALFVRDHTASFAPFLAQGWSVVLGCRANQTWGQVSESARKEGTQLSGIKFLSH